MGNKRKGEEIKLKKNKDAASILSFFFSFNYQKNKVETTKEKLRAIFFFSGVGEGKWEEKERKSTSNFFFSIFKLRDN